MKLTRHEFLASLGAVAAVPLDVLAQAPAKAAPPPGAKKPPPSGPKKSAQQAAMVIGFLHPSSQAGSVREGAIFMRSRP